VSRSLILFRSAASTFSQLEKDGKADENTQSFLFLSY
jgi:hypothetical protein